MSPARTPTTREVDALAARVDAVSGALQSLVGLLAREHDALCVRTDPAALDRIASDKHAAVEQVASLYAALRESLALLDGGDRPLADSIATLRAAHPALAARVARLVDLTRACQQANRDNGVLVSAGLRSAHRALDALHGPRPGQSGADTYGPAGRGAARAHAGSLALTV